ncbi:hypothetical protein KY348_01230 [Candidatus Woesearchaeota archaeon]|nr:hypothetical protein [Candidatus Woesearchaeota archaeon]
MINAPACVAKIAREEGWDQINLEIEPFHTLMNGSLAGYQVIAGNPKHKRRYEVKVIPAYERFKTKTPNGKNILVENSLDLKNISKLKAFCFLRDNMIPKAQRRDVKTNIDLKTVKEEIQRIVEGLNKRYLTE